MVSPQLVANPPELSPHWFHLYSVLIVYIYVYIQFKIYIYICIIIYIIYIMHYIYEFNLIKIVALHFHIWLTIIEIQGEVPILRTGGLPWTTPKEDPARRPCFLYFRLAVTHSVWNLSSCLRKHIVNGAETSCNICTYQDQWSGQLADFVEIAGKNWSKRRLEGGVMFMSRLHVFIKQPLQEKLKEVPSDRSNQYLGEIIGVQPTIRSLSDVLQVGTYIYRCKTNFWRLCSLQQMHTFKDYGVQPTIRRPTYLWGYNHL